MDEAAVRKHEGVLATSRTLEEGEVPEIYYHRKCCSLFTMKKDLEELTKIAQSHRMYNIRPTSTANSSSRVYARNCVFCQKDKYVKGTRNREKLVQCVEMRGDQQIRNAALMKNDSSILTVVARELVAAEACYRDYTRPMTYNPTIEADIIDTCDNDGDESYNHAENQAFSKLFDYIRIKLLRRPKPVRFSELYKMFASNLKSQRGKEVKESTRTHFRRKFEREFTGLLDFEL